MRTDYFFLGTRVIDHRDRARVVQRSVQIGCCALCHLPVKCKIRLGIAHQLNHQQLFTAVFQNKALFSLQDFQGFGIYSQNGKNRWLTAASRSRLFFIKGVIHSLFRSRDIIPAIRLIVKFIRSGSPKIRFRSVIIPPVGMAPGSESVIPEAIITAMSTPVVIVAPGIIIIPDVVIVQGIVINPAVFIIPAVIVVIIGKTVAIAPVVNPWHILAHVWIKSFSRHCFSKGALRSSRQACIRFGLAQNKCQRAVAVVLCRKDFHAAERVFIQSHGFSAKVIIRLFPVRVCCPVHSEFPAAVLFCAHTEDIRFGDQSCGIRLIFGISGVAEEIKRLCPIEEAVAVGVNICRIGKGLHTEAVILFQQRLISVGLCQSLDRGLRQNSLQPELRIGPVMKQRSRGRGNRTYCHQHKHRKQHGTQGCAEMHMVSFHERILLC